MKKNILIILMFLISFAGKTQVNSELILKIKESNLLSINRFNQFEKLMNNYDTITNYECLKGLSTVFRDNIETLQYENIEKLNGHIQVYKENMILLLGKIKDCNLVDDEIYSKYLIEFQSNPLKSEWLILQDLANMVESNLFKNKYYLNLFANHLISKKIVDSKKNSLLDAISNNKIIDVFEFESYCDRTVTINLKDYGDNPLIQLEKIYKKTSSILYELYFTDFEYSTTKNKVYSIDNDEFYDLEIRLKLKDKKYRFQTYFIKKNIDSVNFKYELPKTEYFKIFNNVLAENGSSFRLRYVNFGLNFNDSDKFAIIAVKKNQEIDEDFKGSAFFSFNKVSYNSRMSENSISELIEKAKNIGLFNHISEAEFQDLKTKSIEYGAENQLSVVQRFPNILHSYSYYSEESNSYIDFLKFVDSLSNHSFQFTNYKDNYFDEKKKDIKVTFKVNGKKYTYKDKEKDFWLGNNSKEKFLGFVNQILEENGHKYKFYFISYDEEEMLDFILLTDEQLKYINTHKLLGFTLE